MHCVRQNKPMLSPESALASEIFDQFVTASTFKSILNLHRQMCETLRIKPSTFPSFYVKLKSKLRSWKAASLWSKLDKRAGHKCYNRGKAASGSRVLIIGAGPCGLRTAIEAQLLGAKVVVIEKRDRFSRNNVLHLWPFVIHDLRNLGAKKFYGKFCAGAIDHISIRQLQCILLKVALLLGVEIHENVGFESLIEPSIDQIEEKIGWRAKTVPSDHPVSQYEFGVLIGADGKRNTLSGFKKKEFRGKLAIAITANFINKHSLEEARVEEISGVAFIFNQKFFHELREETGIDLENIVYYKDETHYFVMTAKKASLIDKGVILQDYSDTVKLLSAENVDREALMAYAREAADFSTNYKLPHMDFAVNHYGHPDIAMFDFTSMYAAENACQVIERQGHKLLMGLVGDTLLEPFWPTGSGCARGFLSAFDAAWMIRSFASGKLTVLEVLAERECVFRLLAQTTPENLSKDFNGYSLNPASRYPNLNVQRVQPGAVRLLYNSDVPISEKPAEIVIPSITLEEHASIPSKRKRKDSTLSAEMLLSWCKRQVRLYDVQITDLTHSWKSGIALACILHRFRPDLIQAHSMVPENSQQNNHLVFGILEKDYGIAPIITGKEMAECVEPDELMMMSYLSQVYDTFKGEIPYVVRDLKETSPDSEQINTVSSSKMNRSSHKAHHKRQSLDRHAPSTDSAKRQRSSTASKKRSIDRAKMAQLFPYQVERGVDNRGKPTIRLQEDPEKFKDRCKALENKIRHDFGMITCEERRTIEEEAWKKKKPPMPISKIEPDQWNVKMLEEKLKVLREGKKIEKDKQYHVDGSRLTQNVFDSKLQNMDAKLKASGRDIVADRKYNQFDAKMKFLEKKLKVGPDLDVGVRGNNRVASMASQLSKSADDKPTYIPPISKSSSSKSVYMGLGVHGSEVCYFCKQRVYLMERMSAEGLFFHHGCFKCEYCGTSLRLGGYAYDRTKQFGGKFYCQAHFGMQRVERPRYTRHVLSPEGTPVKQTGQMHLTPPTSSLNGNRGLTPERAEFENSYVDMTSDEEPSELDEDEWTERNFGSSFEQDTSDDEFSDLSTDSESDSSLEEEVERSMTVDETRRLAERWTRRYSRDTLVDVDGSTDEDIGSDTDSDTDAQSDVFSSDEDYQCKDVKNKKCDTKESHKVKTEGHESDSSTSTLDRDDKNDFLNSDDYSSYTESESEPEPPPVQHQIPEIVIDETPSKKLDSDEEHLVPEAIKTFQDENSVYSKEKIMQSEKNNGDFDTATIKRNKKYSKKAEKTTKSSEDPPKDVSKDVEDLIQPMANQPVQGSPAEAVSEKPKQVINKDEVDSKPKTSEPDPHAKADILEPAAKQVLSNDIKVPESTIFIKTVTGPLKTEPPRSRLDMLKAKCRDDERRHTSPVSLRDISRAKEEFLKCGGDMKKRSASPVKKDALVKTLQSIEQLQKVLESQPKPEKKDFGSTEALDRLQRATRSMSPEKKTVTSSLFSSRFRPSPLVGTASYAEGSRGYILSKTASASCVPNTRIVFAAAADQKPSKTELPELAMTLPTEVSEPKSSFNSPLSPKITLEPVFEDQALKLESAKVEIEPQLLSPKRGKNDDIMLDSESMSSTSTLNEDEEFTSVKIPEAKPDPISQTSVLQVPFEDIDADEFSGSDWAHDDLPSACEDDIEMDLGFNKPFVTTRGHKKPSRKFSWEGELGLNDYPSSPKSSTGNAAPYGDTTPIVDARFIESEDEDDIATPVVERPKAVSKSLELLKQSDDQGSNSDDSMYQTPDANMNTKYKGYTGNFARKISPFGSILDSVLNRKSESFSTENIAAPETKSSADETIRSAASTPNVAKCDRKKLELNLLSFDQLNGDKKIVRRRSIHGDTPKSVAEDDIYFTPSTSRKKCSDQRPWSVYGTPTETRKALPFASTPDPCKGAVDFRQLTTVERDKLRNEARQRARLKSDEELGLSPSYYRRKYSSRTDSVSEQPENSDDLAKDLEESARAALEDHVSNMSPDMDPPEAEKILENKNETVIHSADDEAPILPEPLLSKVPDTQIPTVSSVDELPSAENLIVKPSEKTDSPLFKTNDPEPQIVPLTDVITESPNVALPEPKKVYEVVDESVKQKVKPTAEVTQISSCNTPPQMAAESDPKPIEETIVECSSQEDKLDFSGNHGNTVEKRNKKKTDDDKPAKRKSFFSMLNLVKSPENMKKQERSKDASLSGNESSPTTLKNGKERSFLRLKLSRSKEKFREKKKECDRGEALVPPVPAASGASVDDLQTPITSVDISPIRQDQFNSSQFNTPNLPPRASDDSFTESEGKSPRFDLSAEQLLNRSDITEKIVAESLLERKNVKEHEDRQQKLQRIAKKVQKQQEWKRHRLAQQIQRSLEELDVRRRQLEQQGVQLEKAFRKPDGSKQKSSQVMNDWLNMVHHKNKLNNEEQDLLIRLKELQLEDRHSRLQKDLRSRMAVDDACKDKSEIDEERRILKEMLEIVEERDALVEVLAENKLKQEKADKEFVAMMQNKNESRK